MKRYCGALLCLAMAAPALFFCTNLDMAGGSSSTDNGKILGMICLENSLPASHTRVTLRPADFDPYQDTGVHRIDTTDDRSSRSRHQSASACQYYYSRFRYCLCSRGGAC
jgi:hypothetical protein